MTKLIKRTVPKVPTKQKSKILILSLALLMCMSFFLTPATAYAAETANPVVTASPNTHIAPPTVEAEIIGSLLRIRAMSGFYAVEAVYINDRRFNHRVDSALVIDISGFIATGDTISVHAVDFAGNHSNTVLLTPPAPFQPPAPNNITPDGHGEILDHLTNSDLIEFITINTPTGNVFYLVIDHTRNNNNVFFLNPVTEWDLLTLAQDADLSMPPHVLQLPPTNQPIVTEHEPPPITEEPTLEEPQAEPDEDDSGGRAGTFIFLAIAGAGAFGVIYYLKILKPKKEREMYGDGGDGYDDDDGFEDVDEYSETEAESEATEENPDAYDVDNDKYI